MIQKKTISTWVNLINCSSLQFQEGTYFFVVFEYLEKGELLAIPTDNPLPEDEAWNCFRDVILGLEYCKC